jgi:hypothetical protein
MTGPGDAEITVHVTADTTEFMAAMDRCRAAMAAVPRIPLTLPVHKPWWHVGPFWRGYAVASFIIIVGGNLLEWLLS